MDEYEVIWFVFYVVCSILILILARIYIYRDLFTLY